MKVARRTHRGPAYANLHWRKPREVWRGGASDAMGLGDCECEYNFCDMARTLRMGENAFRRSCNFRELGVAKKAHITTFALCA
jgi:hypothetical protein